MLSPSPSSNTNCPDPSFSKASGLRSLMGIRKARSCSPLPTSASILSSQDLTISAPSSDPVTPASPVFDGPAMSHKRTGSTATSHSARSTRSVRSSCISSPLASPNLGSRHFSGLPGTLGWLRSTHFELWIDQDNSRTFRPVFKLTGYTNDSSEDHEAYLVNALTFGLADFMPVTRQEFLVNAVSKTDATLTLRRLTMAGDESKDYISQVASLPTDEDGVYSVSGVELFDVQASLAPLALRWKFEYFVHNALDASASEGRFFTPLRFSCSPGLLHPTHGKKKTRLMELFTRTPSARLRAEKMSAPKPGPSLIVATGSPLSKRSSGLRPLYKDDHSPGPGASSFDRQSGEGQVADHSVTSTVPGYSLRRSPKLAYCITPPSTLTELMSTFTDTDINLPPRPSYSSLKYDLP
ncbi:hypothetical protein POSPLADRAFT_1042225 [Postia placenta MAD-698-R-SB12]|uniref:Uncharacterized protein n=1 Tax=Postia placenta MAD-698-R-SB12 TaxID=670580 RepID=A0A1X6NEA5_9APHY|nr:hypothetical protein POSPLADRAFT_1042225 [Postia placenta MAD-698-R-SB12]OSX66924.1 hypothetical protein POSPLADRAFT_1042225 [Postia placenta MAD-698-R-SB12]